MAIRSIVLTLLLLAWISTGCLGRPRTLPACDPWEPAEGICGLMNPEDLAPVPDGRWLVVSEMARADPRAEPGAPLETPGRLTALRLANPKPLGLFPGRHPAEPLSEWSIEDAAELPIAASGRGPDWGDGRCSGPPEADAFQPHGIDIGRHPDGPVVLAVVNHGGREAVELFELAEGDPPTLAWRGCVPMPPGIMTNDVALRADGGFFVTNFMPALDGGGAGVVWSLFEIGLGRETGNVLLWRPGGKLMRVAGSEGSAPNGIAATPDGRTVFVAEWGGQAIYRIRRDAPLAEQRDEVALEHSPDNLTWTPDGRLMVAAQHGPPIDALGCGEIREGGCDIGYSVYLIDPASLEVSPLLEGRGAASVALEREGEIFIGVFAGDGVARVPRPDGSAP